GCCSVQWPVECHTHGCSVRNAHRRQNLYRSLAAWGRSAEKEQGTDEEDYSRVHGSHWGLSGMVSDMNNSPLAACSLSGNIGRFFAKADLIVPRLRIIEEYHKQNSCQTLSS